MMSAESQNRLRQIDVLNFEHTAIVPVCEAKPKRKKKPGMSFERKKASLERMINQVMPAFV